jgi:hypothetical protein
MNKIIRIQYIKNEKMVYVTRDNNTGGTIIRVYHRPSVYTLDRIKELVRQSRKNCGL